MKKSLAILLICVMMFSFGGCETNDNFSTIQDEENTTPEETITTPQEETATSTQETGIAPEAVAEYEVTYSNANVFKSSYGNVLATVIFSVKNTGDTNLYLRAGAYDLEDTSGK